MALEASDPFDGGSPLFFPDNDENYEDLPGIQYPDDYPELPMLDFEDGLVPTDCEVFAADTKARQQHAEPNTTNSGHSSSSNASNEAAIVNDLERGTASSREVIKESDRIRSLLAGSTGDNEASLIQPETLTPQKTSDARAYTDVPIKEETSDFEIMWHRFNPAEVIEISDTEEITSDKPVNATYRFGTSMADGTIEISDREAEIEEIIVYDDGSTTVAIKKEDPDVEFLGASKNPVDAPEDSSSEDEPQTRPLPKLGNCLLKTPNSSGKRNPVDLEQLKRMQRLYKERSLANRAKDTGAVGNLKIIQSAVASSSAHASSENEFSWMSDTILPDQPAVDFRSLKQSYKAKLKSRKNTLEDDIAFKKARMKENNRLKILALETAESGSSEEEAEESDDGLFVSEGPPRSSAKPRSSVPVDEDDDEDRVLAAMLTGKPALKKSKADAPSSKPELSTRRHRAKDREREERSNMMAGIEAVILRDQKRTEDAAVKEAEAQEAAGGVKRPHKRKQTKPVDNLAKRTKTGRMNNIGSLTNSNIYEDSNANLDKPALPHVPDKKKNDFITSLIANIPLADQKQAKSDKIDIVRATRILGNYKVVPDGRGHWAFKGMKSSLYHYQVQGAAYMKTREIGDQAPYGGILADEMGLGKTVQMIATMVANPQLDPNLPRCTLVVCSPALMGQWDKELELHAEEKTFGRVVRHHGNHKYSGKGAAEEMEKASVILTTYGEVVRSYPSCALPKELETRAEKEEWWLKHWNENRDLLHRALFYRVVLDEAQVIKNHTSQTSIACRALMAKHRWAISGTPIQNRLDELFPYFKFLRVKHTGSIGVFRQNFCLKSSDVCNKRLHSMLDGLMVRRCHQDSVLGAPLIKLPKNTQETIRLKFNKVERAIYELVRRRCINYINLVAKDGTLEEKTKAVIVMFQRLRQMVSHIFMVQEVIEKEAERAEGPFSVDAMWNDIITEDPDFTSSEEGMMLGLKRMLTEKKNRPEDRPGTGLLFTNLMEQHEAPKPRKKAGTLIVRFGKFLKELKKRSNWDELRERSLCHTCGQPPEDPHVTSCMHVYCEDCLHTLAYDASKRDLDHTPCGKCGTIYKESVSCRDLKELEIRDLSASVFQDGKDKTPAKKPFKLTMDYVDSKDGLLLSTKCAAVKAQLAKWIAENPDCKIIVFTEWLMVMHVLGRVCQEEGWKCCHYNGKMSHNARDEALSAFRDDKSSSDVQILIASLKCGGTGLNLTVASRVICVDLWFNKCVEQQAFARVFRFGQNQETYITRCVVEDTVDERLVEMQEEKSKIISTAMDDRSIMAQLTLPELLKLFGPVAYDENSKPFILVDDVDDKRSNHTP